MRGICGESRKEHIRNMRSIANVFIARDKFFKRRNIDIDNNKNLAVLQIMVAAQLGMTPSLKDMEWMGRIQSAIPHSQQKEIREIVSENLKKLGIDPKRYRDRFKFAPASAQLRFLNKMFMHYEGTAEMPKEYEELKA